MFRLLLAGSAAAIAADAATAEPAPAPSAPALVDAAFVDRVRSHLASDVVVMSVRNQNAEHTDLSQDDIDRLDAQWRAEREAVARPLIAVTLANPLSNYLTRIQAHSIGLFTEIFITDAHGLNVGQSNITEDYWQGDEAKFQRTFPRGPGAVFLDEPAWHGESATWRVQINLTVDDPETREPIGAATFEINLTELARRSAIAR